MIPAPSGAVVRDGRIPVKPTGSRPSLVSKNASRLTSCSTAGVGRSCDSAKIPAGARSFMLAGC